MTQLSYAGAGVSIEAGDELVERIKPAAKRTLIPGVLNGIGGFGALFEIGREYRNPVLVSGTDGVGTKLMLAFKLGRHDTVGQDLVAMSVNDILVQGAKSLFFLDYYGCGKLNVDIAERVVKGIAKGCELAGCALIGGETAEMPGFYSVDEYDLAGFSVGAVDKAKVLDKKTMRAGDVVIGLASIIIGEVIFGKKTSFGTKLVSVVVGSIIYRIIVAVVLQMGLNTDDLKLLTAILVAAALTVPVMLEKRRLAAGYDPKTDGKEGK